MVFQLKSKPPTKQEMKMVEKPKLEVVTALPDDASDLSDLWFDPALGDGLTDTVLHDVPVSKPKDFFRVHPDPNWRREESGTTTCG